MTDLASIAAHARAILDEVEKPETTAGQKVIGVPDFPHQITVKVAQEIVEHEAIVQEAYLDSKNVWTWGVGVTNKSGHRVERYKDNPASIERCIEIYVWLLRTEYAPDVLAEFQGHDLAEHQFAAALSFHWNTGAIRQASWCDSWKAGNIAQAEQEFMNWRKPPEIIERRTKEQRLFFHGEWAQDGMAPVIPVRKPSYKPDWGKMRQVDIREELKKALEK